jgi:4a-hydroxytetrahydrobiopterin dehydratase
MPRVLTREEIDRQLESLPDWTVSQESTAISARYELADFAAALRFVNEVGAEAEDMNHHPDIDIRWNVVTLARSTHSEGVLTQLEVELAHRIARRRAEEE